MDFFGNLAHQITLLAINEQTGRVRNRGQLKLAAAGATLAELAMQERVSLVDKKVQVHDARPIGDPLLDAMLRVLGTHPAHRPARIIQAGGGFYLDQSLEDMTRSGWLVKTRRGAWAATGTGFSTPRNCPPPASWPQPPSAIRRASHPEPHAWAGWRWSCSSANGWLPRRGGVNGGDRNASYSSEIGW